MKIGDKVRFTNDGGYSAPTGSTARVVGTKAPWIQVEWIDKGDSGQIDGSYHLEHFEVVPEYEVDKWYKCITGYKKFSQLKEHKFYYSEEIYESKHSFLNDWIQVSNIYAMVNDLSEIQDYLPEGHPDKIIKFEVDKWYKMPEYNWYVKFSHIDGYKWYFTEKIISKKISKPHNISLDWCNTNNSFKSLTDSSEIQQYLPDGHPDKIVEQFPERWYTKTCTEVGNWLDENSDMPKNRRKDDGYATTAFKYLVYPSMEGSHMFGNPACFKKDGYEEITFEQFKEHYLKNKTVMSKQKLTVPVTDVLEIHKIACSTWKEKIVGYLSRVDSDQNITFTQREIDKMFEAATGDQEPVLEKVFGKKGPLTLTDMAGDRPLFKEDKYAPGEMAMIEVRSSGEYEGRAFYLNRNFNWELKTDLSNFYSNLILVPTPKN
jgi:hypothetical protein